jgi:hypothetical protein
LPFVGEKRQSAAEDLYGMALASRQIGFFKDAGRIVALKFDQVGGAAQAAVASGLLVRRLGRKGFTGRSRFSRRIISVRNVVRIRFFISSDNRTLPVPIWANFMAAAAT